MADEDEVGVALEGYVLVVVVKILGDGVGTYVVPFPGEPVCVEGLGGDEVTVDLEEAG